MRSLRHRIDRLHAALAPPEPERVTYIDATISWRGLDYSGLGFRDTDAEIEEVPEGGGRYRVLIRVPVGTTHEDCHEVMTEDQVLVALYANNTQVNLPFGAPERAYLIEPIDLPFSTSWILAERERRRPFG
jgi:hypothetical protein